MGSSKGNKLQTDPITDIIDIIVGSVYVLMFC